MKEKINIRRLLLLLIIIFAVSFLLFSMGINWFLRLILVAFTAYFLAKYLGLVGKGKYKFPKEP
ncbi:MAG: hypothetical protein ABH830_02300 [Patescibacteria group bacterium]